MPKTPYPQTIASFIIRAVSNGSGLIPNCAGHQAVDYSRGAPRRRSLKPGRRPRQPATSRQGARRGAHRRPPHTSPTTVDDRQYRRPWQPNAPSQETHYAYRLRPISTPGLGLAGGKDTAALRAGPSRHRDIPNLAMTQQLLWGAGKTPSAQRRVHPLRDPHALWAFSLLV